ncbi:AI-2E family transporter [Microbacterium lushaniae]|uniref:AI-2E family transporter n=1 Tax=Microbacterium lushaniae TaxID=2614639 RepID=A0A5J6L765_9MICO|nr:AI-2E family transporter [Microbacterium lushaniae]QEW04246.1 AI-2E family transporter [Microbacterium lushaniae]
MIGRGGHPVIGRGGHLVDAPSFGAMMRRPYVGGLVLTGGVLTAFTAWTLIGPLAPVVWCIALAAFFAIGLSPLVRALHRWGMPRPLAITAVSSAVALALAGVVLMIVPPVVDQTTQLLARADEFVASGALDSVAAQLQQFVPVAVLDVTAMLDGMLAGVAGATVQTVSSGVVGAGLALGNGFFLTTIVIVLTVYFLASGRWFRGQFVALLPRRHRYTGVRVVSRVGSAVGRYFLGQMLLALITGVTSLILLVATGSALPLLFAAVAMITALIPLIGIPLGALIIVGSQALIAPADPVPWLVLAGWYVFYMAFEAYVLAPRVVGRSVAIPAVMVLLVTLIGGTLYGIIGALLAVPAAVAVNVAVRELRHARARATARMPVAVAP